MKAGNWYIDKWGRYWQLLYRKGQLMVYNGAMGWGVWDNGKGLTRKNIKNDSRSNKK